MKKVCITGSLGLVGSEAVDFFKEKGWEVVGIDDNMRSELFNVPMSTHSMPPNLKPTGI